ncbi:MAG: alpha/beta hydrolase [Bacteroidales bacterium]|nr:alpha/beta hydrolase [Bacteroidales bacterium]
MNNIKCFLGIFVAVILLSCSGPETLEEVPSKYVAMDSIMIHYKTYGKGDECLVFVHGFGCNMNCWQEQFTYFKDKAKLLFIDLPGYGNSDKPHTEYTLDLFADAVKTVIDVEMEYAERDVETVSLQQTPANKKMSRPPCIFIGHSLGTPVCRQVAFIYPEMVSKFVDVDGVYCFYPADSMMMAAYNAFSETFNTDTLQPVIEGFVESLCTAQTPQYVKDYAISTMPETPKYIAYSTMKNLIDEKYWINGKINIPTLVIASKNSEIPPEYEQIMSGLYSDMEYRELDTIGHFIMMEQPEMFNEMVEAFIEK